MVGDKSLKRAYHIRTKAINPFHAIVLFLYPLKTLEFLMFSGVIEREQWHDATLNVSKKPGIFWTLCSIYDGTFCKNSYIFWQKFHHRCLTGS